MFLDTDWDAMWDEAVEWMGSAWESIKEFCTEFRPLLIALGIIIVAAIIVIKLVKKMPKKHLSITEMYDANGRKVDE